MSAQKPGLHPRNRHNGRYDLATLCQVTPELTQFLTLTPGGEQSVDFANPQAVKALNKGTAGAFLCGETLGYSRRFSVPAGAGRADYIHHRRPVGETSGTIPANASIPDIGVGANCIYPLIGVHEYGWRFTGSESSSEAFNSAQAIINGNPGLTRAIRLRRQKDASAIFNGIIHKNEQYEATLCNPPFHDSAASARAGSERKRRNLGQDKDDALNFGGQQQELWCEGGEVAFIKNDRRKPGFWPSGYVVYHAGFSRRELASAVPRINGCGRGESGQERDGPGAKAESLYCTDLYG